MRVGETVSRVALRLAQAGLEDPRMESEFLVAGVLGISRPQLYLERQTELASEHAQRISETAARREARQPLAYAMGQQAFGDLLLNVTPAVLVPRPETELLVEKLVALLDTASEAQIIADVGTGSGNIALSLARHRNVQTVYAIDLSPEALAVARRNAARYDTARRCRWLCGDLLSALPENLVLDSIVANLPYIRRGDLSSLAPEVRCEPRLALDGGPSGLELIFRLIDQAPAFLSAGGMLWLEVGYDQSDVVRRYLAAAPGWAPAVIYPDLSGIPRMVCAQRKES